MTTPHNHPPAFGRKFSDCPRCIELLAGSPPVRWSRFPGSRDREITSAIRAHFAPNGPHARGACGPVCTFGDP